MTALSSFAITVEDTGGRPTVALHGSLDAEGLDRFEDAMAVARTSRRDVVLDVSSLDDATVEGVEALASVATALAGRRRRLLIVGRPAMIRHLLGLGVGDLLHVRGPRPWPAT